MEDKRYVTEDRFEGQTELCKERFARDKERIEAQEDEMKEVRKLTIQMGEILKKYDETIGAHEKRIRSLESQPAEQFGKIKMALISALISTFVGGVVGAIVGAVLASKP